MLKCVDFLLALNIYTIDAATNGHCSVSITPQDHYNATFTSGGETNAIPVDQQVDVSQGSVVIFQCHKGYLWTESGPTVGQSSVSVTCVDGKLTAPPQCKLGSPIHVSFIWWHGVLGGLAGVAALIGFTTCLYFRRVQSHKRREDHQNNQRIDVKEIKTAPTKIRKQVSLRMRSINRRPSESSSGISSTALPRKAKKRPSVSSSSSTTETSTTTSFSRSDDDVARTPTRKKRRHTLPRVKEGNEERTGRLITKRKLIDDGPTYKFVGRIHDVDIEKSFKTQKGVEAAKNNKLLSYDIDLSETSYSKDKQGIVTANARLRRSSAPSTSTGFIGKTPVKRRSKVVFDDELDQKKTKTKKKGRKNKEKTEEQKPGNAYDVYVAEPFQKLK